MRRRLTRILSAPLAAAAVTLTAAPASAQGDGDCGVILPAADRLENAFNLVSPSGTPAYVASQVRNALAPLHGLKSPAAVDLRIRSDMLASQIDASDPYRPASPDQLASDLAKARQQLAAARAYCAP
jgi:phage terminase large subunit-like protein